MKKLLSIFMAIILSVVVVGCSSSDDNRSKSNNESNQSENQIETEYKKYMADGKSRIIDEEYDKAKESFKLALEDKKNDEEAINLIKQIDLLKESIDLNEGDQGAYFSAIKKLIELDKIDTDTYVVKSKAKSYRKFVISNIDDYIASYEELIENGGYEKAKEDLQDIIKKCERYEVLQEQLNKSKKLLKTCENEIIKDKQRKVVAQQNQAKKNKSKKVWCNQEHYVDEKYYDANLGRCKKCAVNRELSSTNTSIGCPICGSDHSVRRRTGVCYRCEEQVFPAVVNVLEDGTVVFEDGSTLSLDEICNV